MKKYRYELQVIILFLLLGCSGNEKNASSERDAQTNTTRNDGGEDAATSDASKSSPCNKVQLLDCVDKDRYVTDLEFIAKERPPGSAHWQAVQDLCENRFDELGYQVERQAYDTGVNIVGVKPGKDRDDEHVIVSAHYDHIEGCPGADDNATGAAGVLEVARIFASSEFSRTLVVACWDEEERGLIGSRYYANKASEQGDTIVTSYVFEMIGYKSNEPNSQSVPTGFNLLFPEQIAALETNEYRGDFVALIHDSNSNEKAASIEQTGESIGLPVIDLELEANLISSGLVTDLFRSDHASFWIAGYPAIMITDSSEFRNKNYHCKDGIDDISTLDYDFAIQIVRATVGSVAAALIAD